MKTSACSLLVVSMLMSIPGAAWAAGPDAKDAKSSAPTAAQVSATPDKVSQELSAPSAATGAFGRAGQLAISTSLSTGLSVKIPDGGSLQYRLDVGSNGAPGFALDYFVIDRLSVGGQFSYAKGGALTLAPRAGYNLDFGPKWSLWLQGGVTYAKAGDSVVTGTASSTSSDSFQITAAAPFLYHFTPHVFLGAGPMAGVGLKGDKAITIGASTLFGGYL